MIVVRYLDRFLKLCMMFACGDNGVWVAPFFEKLAHFLIFVVKIGVVTTKAAQSKKLREWNGIFLRVVDEWTNAINSYESPLVCSACW